MTELKSVTKFVKDIKANKPLIKAYNTYQDLLTNKAKVEAQLAKAEKANDVKSINARIKLRAELKEYNTVIPKAKTELYNQRIKAGLINSSSEHWAGDAGNVELRNEIEKQRLQKINDMKPAIEKLVDATKEVVDYQNQVPDTIKNQLAEVADIVGDTKYRQLIKSGNNSLWLFSNSNVDEWLAPLRKMNLI